MNYFDEIFNRIKEILKLTTDKEVYEAMGVAQGTFTNWRRREKIPYKEINTLCINYKLDLNYILNGNDKSIKQNNNNKNNQGHINIIGHNTGNINIGGYSHKVCEEIQKLNQDEQEYFYNLIRAKVLENKMK